jgi:hypothetical protein
MSTDDYGALGAILFVVGVFIVVIGLFIGYVVNIVKLTKTDFKPPYKAEILRGVGIIVPPVGGIEGWLKIKDN